MDKKFGATWHCAAGQSFAYEIAHEVRLAHLNFYHPVPVQTAH